MESLSAMGVALSKEITSTKPIEVAFPLPRAIGTNIHLHLTNTRTALLVFLTTTTPESTSAAPLGSFVYAMPNRSTPSNPLSTPLYTHSGNLDFTTRLARLLSRKAGKPVYVGNSISFASAGLGGTVEEEMEGFRRCADVIMKLVKEGTEEAQD